MTTALSPDSTVNLVFVHHSCGRHWLNDNYGELGKALADNNYFVSDTYYGWGPDGIGDHTDIGHWWTWFRGERSGVYLNDLYNEHGQSDPAYTRLSNAAAAGENEIVMFKSCYPNSSLKGNVLDPIPTIANNPLKGQDWRSNAHTIANAKGIYIDLLEYFGTRRDKLFVAITAPPLVNDAWGENARVFNNWLAHEWLANYPYSNVAVFDYYNVLTSNNGSPHIHDAGVVAGNHHRIRDGKAEHRVDAANHLAMYPSEVDDSHPSPAGDTKATIEFIPLLNSFYAKWKSQG